jgi:hypothetical protein
MFARDVSVPEAHHTVASGFEERCPGGVIRPPVARVVRVALELHDEPLSGAVEVHDEAVKNVLAAKLQAEDAPIAQQRLRYEGTSVVPPLPKGEGARG